MKNYLLTEFAFRTARSVLQDLGLNILMYEKQTRTINKKLSVEYFLFDQTFQISQD